MGSMFPVLCRRELGVRVGSEILGGACRAPETGVGHFKYYIMTFSSLNNNHPVRNSPSHQKLELRFWGRQDYGLMGKQL
jgi:hypothetical protein